MHTLKRERDSRVLNIRDELGATLGCYRPGSRSSGNKAGVVGAGWSIPVFHHEGRKDRRVSRALGWTLVARVRSQGKVSVEV